MKPFAIIADPCDPCSCNSGLCSSYKPFVKLHRHFWSSEDQKSGTPFVQALVSHLHRNPTYKLYIIWDCKLWFHQVCPFYMRIPLIGSSLYSQSIASDRKPQSYIMEQNCHPLSVQESQSQIKSNLWLLRQAHWQLWLTAEIIPGCANKVAKWYLLQGPEDWRHTLSVSVPRWHVPSHHRIWTECDKYRADHMPCPDT